MTESDAHSTVEKLWRQSLNYSSQSNDALVTPLTRALETIVVVLSHSSDNERIERSIESLDNERKIALKYEKNEFVVLRQLSFDLIESLQVLLEVKGKKIEEQKQSLVDEAPNSTMTIVVPKEEPTNPIDQILEGNQLTIVDDDLGGSLFKEEEIDLHLDDNNATLPMEKSLNELPSNDIVSHGNIVHSDVMEDDMNRMGNPAPNSTMEIVVPKEEPMNPIDQILEGSQLPIVDDFLEGSLFKEEEIDLHLDDNNATLPMKKSLNDFPSNDKDSHGNIVHSDVIGDDMNCMGDPIIEDHNSTPIDKDSLVGNMGDSDKTEMNRKEKDSMEEEEEKKGKIVQHTANTPKNSDGGKKNIRPSRTSSRSVNYTDSIDESEPLMKKPKIKSEKKINHKRGSKMGPRATKMNHVELECPNCEYRSQSVNAWYIHIGTKHSTTPRQMNLALLCECGHESFTDAHSRVCEISKITILRKNSCPQCVMCEVFPKTAYGYIHHLYDRHKTTLSQEGIFLTCSCGHEVRTQDSYRGHSKECNGREYTLHKVNE